MTEETHAQVMARLRAANPRNRKRTTILERQAKALKSKAVPRKRCSIEGCKGFVKTAGYCGKHYQRWQRGASIEGAFIVDPAPAQE